MYIYIRYIYAFVVINCLVLSICAIAKNANLNLNSILFKKFNLKDDVPWSMLTIESLYT